MPGDTHVLPRSSLLHSYKWPATSQRILWPVWLLFHWMPTLPRNKEGLYPWFRCSFALRSMAGILVWKVWILILKGKPFFLTRHRLCSEWNVIAHVPRSSLHVLRDHGLACRLTWVKDHNEVSRASLNLQLFPDTSKDILSATWTYTLVKSLQTWS